MILVVFVHKYLLILARKRKREKQSVYNILDERHRRCFDNDNRRTNCRNSYTDTDNITRETVQQGVESNNHNNLYRKSRKIDNQELVLLLTTTNYYSTKNDVRYICIYKERHSSFPRRQ
jgi:hypothetical protein